MNSETSTNKILRAVLYERLSKEDGDKLTKEEKSESIKNQDLMLRSYAIEHGYEIVGVYNDEDWSGADSSRPQFNEMIKACEAGEIDVVIAKTQSRFARDMELIERYLHNKFLEWNVQFKSVVDHIDNTRRETKKTSQILGLTDEWYLEDTSINITINYSEFKETEFGIGNGNLWLQCELEKGSLKFCSPRKSWKSETGKKLVELINNVCPIKDMKAYKQYTGALFFIHMFK